jgi:hypothetical protein
MLGINQTPGIGEQIWQDPSDFGPFQWPKTRPDEPDRPKNDASTKTDSEPDESKTT